MLWNSTLQTTTIKKHLRLQQRKKQRQPAFASMHDFYTLTNLNSKCTWKEGNARDEFFPSITRTFSPFPTHPVEIQVVFTQALATAVCHRPLTMQLFVYMYCKCLTLMFFKIHIQLLNFTVCCFNFLSEFRGPAFRVWNDFEQRAQMTNYIAC